MLVVSIIKWRCCAQELRFPRGFGKLSFPFLPFLCTICALGSPPFLARPAPQPSHVSQPVIASLCCLHPGGARLCTQRTAPESQTGPGLQGLRGRHVGPDSALVEEADFLTLQGSVWSRASGWRPVDPGAARVGGTNEWQRHLAKARVPGLEFVGNEGVGREKGVRQCSCGWGRSRLREGICSILWEEALWNHFLFWLLTSPYGNQDWLPSALLGCTQDLPLRAQRSQFLVGSHLNRESVTRACSYPGAI